MAEIDAGVMAQLHRIHQAVNAGTLDRDTVNDALRVLHDLLSGAAYEEAPPMDEPAQELGEDEEEVREGGEAHPHKKKPRKKR